MGETVVDLRMAVAEESPQEGQVVQGSHPTAYDKASNGLAEGAVRVVTGQLRTLKVDLERELRGQMPSGEGGHAYRAIFSQTGMRADYM